MPQSKFTVVIPCYNEEAGIRKTIESIRECLGSTTDYELLVVNDGSTDKSRLILDELLKTDFRLRVVHHEFNQGYGAALKKGIRRANTELIVITDADGTYPSERIPELVNLAHEADMIVGARTADEVAYSLIRKIPKVFLRAYASWLVGVRIPDINSGMRVFRKSVAERYMKLLPDTFSFTTTITMAMMRNRYDVRFVPISYTHRLGESKIRPIRDTLHFVQLILRTGMYFGPLRVLTPLIALMTLGFLISLGYDIFILSNLTDKTILLLLFSLNTAIFALLADMIDKRSNG